MQRESLTEKIVQDALKKAKDQTEKINQLLNNISKSAKKLNCSSDIAKRIQVQILRLRSNIQYFRMNISSIDVSSLNCIGSIIGSVLAGLSGIAIYVFGSCIPIVGIVVGIAVIGAMSYYDRKYDNQKARALLAELEEQNRKFRQIQETITVSNIRIHKEKQILENRVRQLQLELKRTNR